MIWNFLDRTEKVLRKMFGCIKVYFILGVVERFWGMVNDIRNVGFYIVKCFDMFVFCKL